MTEKRIDEMTLADFRRVIEKLEAISFGSAPLTLTCEGKTTTMQIDLDKIVAADVLANGANAESLKEWRKGFSFPVVTAEVLEERSYLVGESPPEIVRLGVVPAKD